MKFSIRQLNMDCIWPVSAQLGEGAIWSERDGALWFVDITARQIHRLHVQTNTRSSWEAPSCPGFIALTGNDEVLVGLTDGLYGFTAENGSFRLLCPVGADRPMNRLNDGSVGPDGSLWFGSKNEPEDAATGAWYRWNGSLPPAQFDDGYIVTNGPAFSPDGCTLYHSDSTQRRILARDVSQPELPGENQLFATIEEGAGYPDGLATDEEGCLWVALWAGAAVRRYAPNGELLQHLRVPCPNVTKPAFGGEDGKTLFLTTAAIDLTRDQRAAYLDAGGLFSTRVDVAGLPIGSFKLAGAQT